MRSGSTSLGGVSAMAGGILALVITPVFATSYLAPDEEASTPLIDAIRPSLEPLLDFASVERVYRTYGLAYLVCALLMFYGYFAFRSRIALRGPDAPHRALTVLIVGWPVFLIGLLGDYAISDALGDVLHGVFFLVEMLGLLAILVGGTMLGLRLRRTDVPSPTAWMLVLVIPIGIAGVILLGHLPSGPMVGVCLASIVVGYTLLSDQALAA
jgi:hypothetical protein